MSQLKIKIKTYQKTALRYRFIRTRGGSSLDLDSTLNNTYFNPNTLIRTRSV